MTTHPRLSFVLFTPDTFETIRKTVSHAAHDQSVESIELLIGCTNPQTVAVDTDAVRFFHSVRVVRCDMTAGSGEGRALFWRTLDTF